MYYKAGFLCPETGEKEDLGPFESRDDALCAREYPGYGSADIQPLTDEEAIELIAERCKDMATNTLMDEGLDPDDRENFYPVFYDLIWEYHDQMQPGYSLVPDYMKDKPIPQRTTQDVIGINDVF